MSKNTSGKIKQSILVDSNSSKKSFHNDSNAPPKIFIFVNDTTEGGDFAQFMWELSDNKHTPPYIMNRFLRLFHDGKRHFPEVNNEEYVGLVGPATKKDTKRKISSKVTFNKKTKLNNKKIDSDEEEEDVDEEDEDEDKDDDEDEEEEEEEEEEDDEDDVFQISVMNDYFEFHLGQEFIFPRKGFGMEELGKVTFMINYSSV